MANGKIEILQEADQLLDALDVGVRRYNRLGDVVGFADHVQGLAWLHVEHLQSLLRDLDRRAESYMAKVPKETQG